MENAKLKTDLAALRKVTADGETGGQELLSKLFLGLFVRGTNVTVVSK
jgi:hypothetical protein